MADYSITEAEKIKNMKAIEVYSYSLASQRLMEIDEEKERLRDLNKLVEDSIHGAD